MKRLCLLLAACLLAACGYSLRGSADLSPALQTLYLETLDLDSDMSRELRRALTSNGVELLTAPAAGVYRLGIGQERSVERVLSVNSNARAGEYEISMSVPFQLRDENALLLGPETITLDSVYLTDPNNAVAKEEEAELIREELRREMVVQILRRLQTLDAAALGQP